MRLDLSTLMLAFAAPLVMPAAHASELLADAPAMDMPAPLTAEEAARFGHPTSATDALPENAVASARDIFARERMVLESDSGLVPLGPWWARPNKDQRPIML